MSNQIVIKNHGIKEILKLSYPVMLGMILQTLLGSFDLYFIGKLGTVSTASASLGTSIGSTLFVMSALVAAGVIPLIARSYGSGDYKRIKEFTSSAILLSIVFGLIIGLLSYFNASSILKLMYNPDETTLGLAVEYSKIVFLATPVVFLNTSLKSVLQGIGDTKTPLIIFGFANIINIILDPIFIFTLGMGIRGAAIATVIARVISLILILIVIAKKVYASHILEVIKNIKFDRENNQRILRIGSWACIQQITRPITGMLMFRIVFLTGGAVGVAAFGVGGQLFGYTFIFISGLGMATSILVGQALGRGDVDDARRVINYSMKLCMINMAVFIIPYIIFPEAFMKIFIQDPDVVAVGVNYLRITYVGLVFVVVQMAYGGAFNGSGDTKPPMIASLVANVTFKLPLAYYLSVVEDFGTNGVWIAISSSVIVEAIILVYYFRAGNWVHKKI
ncbi:MAG: MATE family efflux transporter [Acidaminobacteraceae bacterium]